MTLSTLAAALHEKRRTALSISFALALSSPVLAQESAPQQPATIRLSPEDVERGLNGPQKNFWFATGASQEYQNAGFFGQRLRPYISDDAEAVANLNRYRRQKWLYLGERFVFLGALSLYGQQVLAKDEWQYFNNTQKAAVGVAVGSLLANALITRHTNQHFVRSVEAHNATLPAARRMGMERALPNLLGVTAPTGRPQLLVGWSLR
ncbi:hypothetical protein F0P96_07720 [Hymenobacter busanensis]|uniref:Uncharacterized protein n=1 Tax=Hymenobacter busanensis TaxID=2607656 RepID=A0A7L4ZZC1_9BACT|nr:hypothetical protein [Hymenobacter busanensis]KAA9338700.1 hypothetical protein F0P96_07720 [Hymenobacter busanensis]QHJ08869.1 hypothetical protein GUY19_16880 [Hymenobacter busanensis]